MIPNKADTVEVVSSGFERSFQMGFDEASIVHLMDILTKMYSDALLACIREYSANAYDSHIKAGQTRPVEVTLPNRWSKTLIIRDYGVGMNADYMENVYSKYGASDKKESDEYVGGFGIGSKSGLAYTHSFTVTAWQNGVRTRAIISLDNNGAGKFDIVDEVKSDEDTGVEIKITIASEDIQACVQKAENFFSFWPEGTVLVDGAAPDRKDADWQPLNDNVSWKRGNGYWDRPESHIIAGIVAYPLDHDQIPGAKRLLEGGVGVRVTVGVSDVSIAPNREQLAYTPVTVKNIEKHLEGVYENMVQAELARLASMPNRKEAHHALNNIDYVFRQDVRFQNLSWNGLALRQRVAHNHFTLTWDWQDKGYADERHWVDITNALRNTELIVTGFTGQRVSTVIKRKIREYCNQNSMSAEHVIITDNDITDEWLDDIARIDLETIKAVKLPAGQQVTVKREPTYDVYTATGYESATKVTGKNILYVSPVDLKQDGRYGITSRINCQTVAEYLDATIVVISRNRFDKFLRDYPKARFLAKAVQETLDALGSKVSGYDVSDNAFGYSTRAFLRKAKPSDILDNDLRNVITAYQGNQQPDPNWVKVQGLYKAASRGTLGITMPSRKSNDALDIVARYPLIEEAGHDNYDHMVIYINAVFEKENI